MFTQFSNAHTEVVTSLIFSPHVADTGEGGLLCSTSGDDTASLWDLRASPGSCHRAAHLEGHHVGPVNHALFHPVDPYRLLTASDDRSIGCWDLRRPDRALGKISGFLEGVNKMLWLRHTYAGCGSAAEDTTGNTWNVVSACDDGHVYVHALVLTDGDDSAESTGATLVPQVGALIDKFRVSTTTVNDIVLAPNSTSVLITASEDCAVRSWSLRQSQQLGGASTTFMEDRLLASLDEFENPVNHVVVAPPGWMAPMGSGTDISAAAATGDTEESAATSSAPYSGTYQAYRNDGQIGAEEGGGGDSETSLQQRTAPDISEAAGTGCWLLAACSECVFGVDFALRSGQFGAGARAFAGHQDYVRGLEFTNEGTLITVSDDSTAIEWNLMTTEPIRQVKLHEGLVMSSAMSPGRTLLATGTDRGEIRVWRMPFTTERMGSS